MTKQDLPGLTPEEYAELQRARQFASWMDDKVKLFGFGVGLDGLIGLVPFVGDALSVVLGIYHINLAGKLKLGLGVQFALLLNLLLDFLIGFVPLIGDILDFAYRSHRRNIKLIERKVAEREGDI